MPDPWYVASALGIAFAITFALRAAPFAALSALRKSKLVSAMALWTPAGLLAILAASTFRNTIGADHSSFAEAALSAAVTAAAHLAFGRRTLVSVGLGVLCYVAMVNLL